MTPRSKYLLAGVALAVIGLGAAGAIARHGHHGWGHHGRDPHGWGRHGGHMGMLGFVGGPGNRFCRGDGAEMADHMLVHLEHKVKPTEAQKAGFEELKTSIRSAAARMQAACPAKAAAEPPKDGTPPAMPNPIERLERAQAMTEATLEAIKTVRPAAEKFYASLSDQQKTSLSERERGGKRWGHGWRHHRDRDDDDGDRGEERRGEVPPAPPAQ
jgi:hypothetical protein